MNYNHSPGGRLDLNLLRVFATIWQERHLTRAATILSLTPSAVSHAMRRLRDHFGDPLFQRQGNRMQPTPTCARMAPELIAQLERMQALLHNWGAFDPAQSRQTFRLAMPEASESVLLPPLLARLAQEAPGVTIHALRVPRAELAQMLARQGVDLAIDIPMTGMDQVLQAPLLSDDFCVLSRTGHPITRSGSGAALEYAGAEHIAVSTRQDGTVIEDLALIGAGLRRHIRLRCQSYSSAVAVAAGSDLLLTLPRHIALSLQRRQTTLTPVPVELPPVRLHLYWSREHDSDPASIWLRELLHETLTLDEPAS